MVSKVFFIFKTILNDQFIYLFFFFLQELMRKSDISKSGDLDLHEFVTYLTDHEKQLRFTFEALDEDQDGKIGVNEVISAFKKSGIVITESEAKSLMQR